MDPNLRGRIMGRSKVLNRTALGLEVLVGSRWKETSERLDRIWMRWLDVKAAIYLVLIVVVVGLLIAKLVLGLF